MKLGKPTWVGITAVLVAATLVPAGSAPAAALSNDNFASGQSISGEQGSAVGDNSEASAEAGEPWHAGSTAAARDRTSSVRFDAAPGATYLVAVDGFNGAAGAVRLAWAEGAAAALDTSPPDTTIQTGPTGTMSAQDASFTFGATEAGSTYECALDGVAFAACSSPRSYSSLAAGAHTFEVRAVDGAGHRDPSPASRSWTVVGDPILLAAGDIAACDSPGDEATAAILDGYPDATVATLGDNVYPDGTAADFANCYAPSWGRHKARTKPSPGNHEYHTTGAAPYYDYFGAAAGERGKGWYSYELGGWHVLVLNSNCEVVACGPGSEQEQWLRSELAASEAQCTLAYWHHPLFTSGTHAGEANLELVRPFWRALYEYGADVVLVGHDHDYERFAPQTPDGAADAVYGLRQFVVGTGGRSLRSFGTARANSEVRDHSAFGVLRLILRSGGYGWQFLPEAGKTFTDTGSGTCHTAPDRAPAANPTLSSTHPSGWSADRTVDVAWSGASDSGSGVDGYSYAWSQHAATTPDTTKEAEETATGTTSLPLADGDWWFHLRTRDNAGNWSSPVHLGPFRIDGTAPGNPTLASPSHTVGDWSNDPTVAVTWTAAADAGSGVDGFSYQWSQSDATSPDMAKEAEETATGTTSPALGDGSWWLHLRTRDNAGNWSAPVHLGPFAIDATAPANPAPSSSTHAVGAWSNDAAVGVAWSTGSDAASGVDGFSIEWSQSAATAPDMTKDREEGAGSLTSARLSDGDWWFHLRTRDNAGNWSGPVDLGPFRIDSTAPGNPTLSSPSHTPDDWSNDSTVELTWSNASDLRSGVDGYSYGWSQDAVTAPDTTKDAEETATATTSLTLADGDWWFHLRTRDNAGNWSGSVHLGPFRIDTTAPTNPTLSSPSHTVGIWSNRETLVIEWGSRPEAEGYSYEWSQTAATTPDTVKDAEGTVTSIASPRPDGSWWFHFRMLVDTGAWSHPSHVGPFRIDTTAPASPAVSSPSHIPGAPSTDGTIDVAWQAADPTSGVVGYSLAWSPEPSTVPDTLADTTETATTSSPLGDGTWWFHVRAGDNAGNWGAPAHLGPFRIETPLPLPEPQPPVPEPQPPPLEPPPPAPEPLAAQPQALPLPPQPPSLQPPPPASEASSCVVPRLAGRTLKQSRTLLARGGCRLGRVGRVFSIRVPKGRVVVQRPRARLRLARGARVNLELSRGRPPRSR